MQSPFVFLAFEVKKNIWKIFSNLKNIDLYPESIWQSSGIIYGSLDTPPTILTNSRAEYVKDYFYFIEATVQALPRPAFFAVLFHFRPIFL